MTEQDLKYQDLKREHEALKEENEWLRVSNSLLEKDLKAQKDHIAEDTKKIVTNADRIRNMSDEELALVIMCPYDTVGDLKEIMPCIKEHGNNELVPPQYCYDCTMNWLKEQVE